MPKLKNLHKDAAVIIIAGFREADRALNLFYQTNNFSEFYKKQVEAKVPVTIADVYRFISGIVSRFFMQNF
ncbi:MAG: hypothetical protein GY730_09995 [bacterium]|nr:hypothetical protein [bacterium]